MNPAYTRMASLIKTLIVCYLCSIATLCGAQVVKKKADSTTTTHLELGIDAGIAFINHWGNRLDNANSSVNTLSRYSNLAFRTKLLLRISRHLQVGTFYEYNINADDNSFKGYAIGLRVDVPFRISKKLSIYPGADFSMVRTMQLVYRYRANGMGIHTTINYALTQKLLLNAELGIRRLAGVPGYYNGKGFIAPQTIGLLYRF